ncbi:hypothetical protein O181_056538 [Austropuccinia psidii MF-1]|uniref:Uncharacterized protein n=1 Tax=Austropuccinia psidii MF-1 TaxID=1389203 RepID=A0A9Q3ED99_9BASI|nr:hypothetical protein [Austropuccinia psidii MF-1]
MVKEYDYGMDDPDYFQQTTVDTNIKRNLVSQIFIEHSVRNSAYESVMLHIFSSNARQIYQALKDCFNHPSWSSVVYHANVLFTSSSDHSNDINEHAMLVTEVV